MMGCCTITTKTFVPKPEQIACTRLNGGGSIELVFCLLHGWKALCRSNGHRSGEEHPGTQATRTDAEHSVLSHWVATCDHSCLSFISAALGEIYGFSFFGLA